MTDKNKEELIQEIQSLKKRMIELEKADQDREKSGEALLFEENKFKAALDAYPEGVYIVNKQCEIEYLNPFLKKEFGAVQNRKCFQYFHGLEEPCPWCQNDKVFSGKTVRWEWTSHKNNRTYDLIDVPILTKDGLVSKLEIFHDITESKKMEETVRKKEEKNKLLSDAVASAFDCFLLTDDKGNINYANRSACATFGYTSEEFIGLNIARLDGDQEFAKKVAQEIAAKGRWSGEVMNVRKNGEKFYSLLSAFIIKDDKGNVKGTMGILRDITDHKKAEAALRESEKRFMDVLHASNDAILLIDGNIFVDCNTTTAQMLGYATRKEFLMTHPSKLSPDFQPDGRKSFEKAEDMMKRALEKGFNRFEWIHQKASGEDFPVEVSLTPVSFQGRTVIHCVWRDLTEIKKIERSSRERLHELEVFYKSAMSREEKIMELKKEIDELKKKHS